MPDHINPTVGPDHEEVDQWRTTSRRAASPPSGTPSTGGPPAAGSRRALLRGAHGGGGLLLGLLAALPPQHPLDHRGGPRVADRRPVDHPQPPAAAAPPQAARPVRRQGRQGHRRRHRPSPRARQRRRAHLVCRGRRAQPVVPQRDRRRVRLRRARPGPRRDGVRRLRGRRGRLRHHPEGDDAPLDPQALHQGPAARLLHRGQQPHRAAEALPVQVRPAARARARTASATCACRTGRCSPRTWARRPATRPRSTSSTAATDRAGSSGTVHTLPFHPLDVVGWDGCLYPYVFNVATSSRSPAGSTSRRRCTRSSRAGTS